MWGTHKGMLPIQEGIAIKKLRTTGKDDAGCILCLNINNLLSIGLVPHKDKYIK